jgi:predicted metal-dependent hydrolase
MMTVVIQGVVYPVTVFYRAKKRMILRFKEESFHVSVPKRTNEDWIEKQVIIHGNKLLEKVNRIPKPFNHQGMYHYGNWHSYQDLSKFINKKPIDSTAILSPYTDSLKSTFTHDLQQRVQYWQEALKIKTPYRIRVRLMHTRLGSNSRRTKILTFTMKLIHFAWPIIDAVIVHELIHDMHFDHSNNFYKALYQAYPLYREEHAKILKGQYK